MATATPLRISTSEYLRTSYRPDCDYVDGVIEERNLGELDHAAVQRALLRWFIEHERDLRLIAYPELRIQASPTRFRVARRSACSRSQLRANRSFRRRRSPSSKFSRPKTASAAIWTASKTTGRWASATCGWLTPRPAEASTSPPAAGSKPPPLPTPATGLRLDLAALFASIDDALGDPDKR